MPPKKTDKGGKGAAAAGPKSGEEPPQPGPNAPYCLSLILEVSLDAAEPRSLVDTSGETAAYKPPVEGSGDHATRNEENPRLVEPEFRYTFVNGERITTPSVGRPGSSWVKLDPAPTAHTNMSGGTASPQQQAAAAAASSETEEATKSTERQDSSKGPPSLVAWRYTRVHQLQGADDDEVKNTTNMRPTVHHTKRLDTLRAYLSYEYCCTYVCRHVVSRMAHQAHNLLRNDLSLREVCGSIQDDGQTSPG